MKKSKTTEKTYDWRVAARVAGAKTARTGRKHVALSVKTGKPYGPNPYRVVEAAVNAEQR